MKKIKVELLNYTPMTTLLKAVAMPYKNEKASMNLAEKVCKVLKHESVSEHVYMSFLIEGISRLELQEHMRHRLSSTTCESTRFTLDKIVDSLNIDNYTLPEFIEEKWDLKNGISPKDNYNEFIEDLTQLYKHNNNIISMMLDKKYPMDYVKYAVPEGYKTRFVWTINIRALNNFLDLRDSKTAHFEIRYVAKLIKEALKNTYIERLLH